MTETFRIARPDEIPDAARLVRHSFPGPARTIEWWRDQLEHPPYGGGAGILWLGEESGRLIAACQLHPLRQWIGGVSFHCMGLGTVAIAPTHRRRGLAGRLATAGLRHARERGDLVSALYPFRVSFYERLGYGLAGEAAQYRVPPEVFPDAPERAGVHLAETDEERTAVRQVYEQWIQSQAGQAERTDRVWALLWEAEDQATALYRGESGGVEGYARVRYRADPPPADRFLEVEERAWLTPAAQQALYAWLGSLGDQWQQIAYRAHPEEGFENRIREPRLPRGSAPGWGLWFPSATLLRGPMFRLLDLRAAWDARRVADDSAFTLALDVRDERVPENGGRWRLRMEGGRVRVEAGSEGAAGTTMSLSISTLSRIFIGDLAPSAAVTAGLATADRTENLPFLDRLLRLPKPWTFDRF